MAQDLLAGQAVCLSSPARAEMLNFEEGRTVRTTGGSQLHTVPRLQCRQFVAISVHPESPSYVVLLGTENHAVERMAYDCMCCGVFLKIICFTQGSVIYPWCFPRVGGYSHPPLQHQSSHTVFYPQGPLFISPCALPTLAGCSRRLRLRSVCERLSLGVHLRFQFAHITFPNYSESADNASAHFILANWLTSHSPGENCPCV